MDVLPKNAALIVIDMQQGFDDPSWPPRNNLYAESNARTVMWAWRMSNRPIFHIRHNSLDANSTLREGKPGYAFKPGFKPLQNETHIVKRVNSAFIGTELKTRLKRQKIETVVLLGLTTNHCVSTTTRMASNFGLKTYLVGDATAAFATQYENRTIRAETVYDVALANLSAEFATIINAQELYGELRSHIARQRASLFIVCDDKLLLMYRKKGKQEYYTIPGGGVERGETPEQAALREAKEETGLDVVIGRKLPHYIQNDHRYLITQFSGDLCVGGPEAERASENNIYRLEWVPFDKLHSINLIAPVASFIDHVQS